MTRQHLNHCMVFLTHQERMDALDLNSIAKEFAQVNEWQIVFFFNYKFFDLIKTYLLMLY